MIPENFQNSFPGEDVIEIPEVTIKGNSGSKRVYHDKYEELYQYANVRSLDYKLLWSSQSMVDAVRRMVSPYIMNDNYIVLRPPRSILGGGIPAMVVLDGMPLYSGGWPIAKTIKSW